MRCIVLGEQKDGALHAGGRPGEVWDCNLQAGISLGLTSAVNFDSANLRSPQGLWELQCKMCLSEATERAGPRLAAGYQSPEGLLGRDRWSGQVGGSG